MTQRTDHEVLVSVAQLLEELLAEAKHIRAALAPKPDIDNGPVPVRCWCGGQDGEHEADAHAEERVWP